MFSSLIQFKQKKELQVVFLELLLVSLKARCSDFLIIRRIIKEERIGVLLPSFKVRVLGSWAFFCNCQGAEGGAFRKGKEEWLWWQQGELVWGFYVFLGLYGDVFCIRWWFVVSLPFCLYSAATRILCVYFVCLYQIFLIYFLCLPIKKNDELVVKVILNQSTTNLRQTYV